MLQLQSQNTKQWMKESKGYRSLVKENEVAEKNEEGGDKRSTAKDKERVTRRTLKNGFTETRNISDPVKVFFLTVQKNGSGGRYRT